MDEGSPGTEAHRPTGTLDLDRDAGLQDAIEHLVDIRTQLGSL